MGKTRRTCAYPGCGTYLTATQAHCRVHSHVAALQQAIEAQNNASPSAVASLIKDYEGLRRIIKALGTVDWLAEPGKSKSLASVGRGGFHDGTVEYGDGVLHSSLAASVKQFQGKKGAMRAMTNRFADELEGILDPNRERRDTRITCGRESCDPRTRHRRQPADSAYCRYCGGGFIEEEKTA